MALLPIIEWTIRQHSDIVSVEANHADLGRVPKLPADRADQLRLAVALYPCDILCVHRDANSVGVETRSAEIGRAIAASSLDVPAIPIVPARATEAWLLIDEQAIREAAANPSGRANLGLPRLRDIEEVAKPKQLLADALRSASGLAGRRYHSFRWDQARNLIPQNIETCERWRELPSFRRFEVELSEALNLRR